ncbi:hypothetical protein GCM10007977_023970 [Dactylosporangium sucinum]|uniref:Uncharacterized protein n=1 Tax=Dactylosporangium sucinum TaxID=1424081 RepID=A0A917TH03_9ACTN|nr:hypothetical protein GCM10007977_023970 [Dactylosporangium sucinum]
MGERHAVPLVPQRPADGRGDRLVVVDDQNVHHAATLSDASRAHMLRHLGYVFGRGYLNSRPPPPDDLAALVRPATARVA